MTSTLAQGVGRSPGEPVRPLSVLALSPALLVLLLVGLVLRLTIAYVLFPASGFESDLASYAAWASTMAEHGPTGFYANAGFADYPPAYLYALWVVGLLSGPGAAAGDLVKLPPILLDVAVAYVLYRLVRGWTWPGPRSEILALSAAALFLFNPVAFYDSALWGQTDVAGALVMLLAVAALARGNSEGAAALAATAALVKPQFGVVLIPVVAAVLLKRHLLRVGSGPRHRPWAPAGLVSWLSSRQGPVRLLSSLATAWLAFFVIALPFGMGPLEYLERMLGTAGGYDFLSVNAFNLWALVAPAGGSPLAQGLAWNQDSLPLLGPIPGVAIGAALLVGGFLWGAWRAAVRDDRWTLIVAVVFLAVAFFILPTRVHERYVYPAIALMPLLAVVSGRWALALLLLSLGAFINLHAVLTLPLYGTDNVESLPLGAAFRESWFVALSALLQTGTGLWVAWQLRPGLATSPDGFERAATAGRAQPAPSLPAGAAPAPYAPVPGLATFAVADGLLERVVARLSWGSLRRDRSALLAREPGGRLDLRDLVVVTLLVIATLALRGHRLDQPVRMYFDEVYHARTAIEFLQHWEYGKAHDIYEFTHPHLAKYAMAWGVRLAGGNHITRTAELERPVLDAALEQRWSPDPGSAERRGDRLWVATGDGLAAYDLDGGELEAAWPLAAAALSVDDASHALYVADTLGRLYYLDTTSLDASRQGSAGSGASEPLLLGAGPGAPVERLLATEASLVAVTSGSVASFDRETGSAVSRRPAVGTTDLLALPQAQRLVVDTRELADGARTARRIASILEEEAGPIERLLALDRNVVLDAWMDQERTDALLGAMEAGTLPGAAILGGPLLAVADHNGVEILDARTLDALDAMPTEAPVTALLLGDPQGAEQALYAASGAGLDYASITDEGLGLPQRMWMPGEVKALAWNAAAGLIHALGEAPEGGPTAYVVEPRGHAVFADVPLPVEPVRILADTQPERPDDDRSELLAIAADGGLTAVGIGGNAFGWRLPGLLMGALGAALLYLLARVLFARRSVALITAVLIVAEGMLFANSRIAMNDVYVATFVVLAALLFAPLYLTPRRPWAAVALLAGVGLALGLALASKWVALYAIGGIGLLLLFRSALGRTLALLALLAMTAVLGAMALRAPDIDDPTRNWIFVALMLLLGGLLAAAVVRRPMPSTRVEVVLAVAAPLAVGVLLALIGRLEYSAYAFALAACVAVAAMLVTATGHGPWARAARLPASGTSIWLRPGRVPAPGWPLGLDTLTAFPWLLTLAALALLPIAVYVLAYAPWVDLGNAWGLPFLDGLPFLPSSSDGGETIAGLTESMYRYHDSLRAEHAASSPWWAWPLDLKPVWFFQERYADGTTGLIYDSGNLVVFWLGLAGMAFSAWVAWRRRSLALTLVVIMWAAMWLPWARIDRVAFQYHVYASLPFMVLALSYFLAELWHGPSARTWLLARLAAALAILAPLLLWLLRTPLCILSGTAETHPEGVACAAQVTRTAQLSAGGVGALLVLGIGAGLALFIVWRLSRPAASAGVAVVPWSLALLLTGVATLAGVVAAMVLLDTGSTTGLTLSSDLVALVWLPVLAVPAWLALRARDPRRLVLGVLAAALLWLLVWYPNISGLPLPSDLAHLYQGLLPTWNWDFQFASNTDTATDGAVIGADTLVVGAIAVAFAASVAAAAWRWGRGAAPPSSARPGAGPLG